MNTLLNTKIEPDVQELIEVLRRHQRPRRVHHLELFLDLEVKQKVGSVNLTMDIRNAIHGLELWPYAE